MKTTTTLFAAIALTFAAAGSAFADDGTQNIPLPATSQLTRAEVAADLAQARAAGQLIANDVELQAAAPFKSAVSRDTVRAEARQTLVSGGYKVQNGERAGGEDLGATRVVTATGLQIAAK